MSAESLFENKILHPIIKMQNDLLILVFSNLTFSNRSIKNPLHLIYRVMCFSFIKWISLHLLYTATVVCRVYKDDITRNTYTSEFHRRNIFQSYKTLIL